jgi:hypothetical protein
LKSAELNRSSRIAASIVAVALGAVFFFACGGSSNSPTPVTPPTNQGRPSAGPSVNLAPVVDSIALSSDRVEVDNEITVTATVTDQETPVEQLKFEWKAPAGTFTGEGATVKWRAPKDIKTPADYEISLTITEAYGTPDSSGKRQQNVATAPAPAVRVHNSQKELGDMSLQFLSDFANSSIPAATCVRDFTDSCKGKSEERGDIEANRVHYEILSSSLTLRSVNVATNGLSASMTVACSFTSKIKACDAGDKTCVVGDLGTARGDCLLTGKYENRRWWLCDSHFAGKLLGSMRSFFGLH